jgi:hypothetical protein
MDRISRDENGISDPVCALALAAPIAAATHSAAVRQQDAKPRGEKSQESRNVGTHSHPHL